jgi:hypothetical protein
MESSRDPDDMTARKLRPHLEASALAAMIAIVLLLSFGCGGDEQDPREATIAPSATTSESEASAPTPEPTTASDGQGAQVKVLTHELLANSEYSFGQKRIKLTNGRYLEPAPQGIPEPYDAEYSLALVEFGDLNADGAEDAVVVLIYNPSGTFASWSVRAVINRNGVPLESAGVGWGDRDRVNQVRIDASGLITVDLTVHDTYDPGCCPTINKLEHYRLMNGELIAHPLALTSVKTQAVATGSVRELPQPSSAEVGLLRPGIETTVIGRSREHGSLLIVYPPQTRMLGWVAPLAVAISATDRELLPFVTGPVQVSDAGAATFYPKAQSFRPDEDILLFGVALHMQRAYPNRWSLRILDGLPAPSQERGIVDKIDLDMKTIAAAEVTRSEQYWATFSFTEVELKAGRMHYLFVDGFGTGREGPDVLWSQSQPGAEPGPLLNGQGWVMVYDWSNNSNVLPEVQQAHYDHAFQLFYIPARK